MKFERQLAWPCRDCGVRGSSFCSKLTDQVDAGTLTPKAEIPQLFFHADEGAVIQESSTHFFPGPYVLCQGWAYRFHRFADGRRQILSVLIPGDLFSAFALFNSQSAFSVQAATDTRICQLGRDAIKKQLIENSDICEALGQLCSTEVEEMATTSVNLTAPEPKTRIAGLVRGLVDRLAARNIRNGANAYPFPLDSVEIADATGLAPDQVQHAIRNLREECIIDLSDDEVTILDHDKFAQLALVAFR